ncbi:hypothetical protein FOMG_18525 [Fusarium oxysporum f. sp. melonis 26406]|uniref:Uncharacterized protein n=1 Tax=Fusarium oxysporum f. sp. melonis 26406 TaxID=1089452 RepID=W9Z935_FUSOX|nr:hypothetical protein FOMG_18944 [Fusarium oxysporum f. sp. melonis 26406]EXK24778.1 hypothetical protein FOMG_18525 [Fusarium oxysporum f. sp. melonis 26406]
MSFSASCLLETRSSLSLPGPSSSSLRIRMFRRRCARNSESNAVPLLREATHQLFPRSCLRDFRTSRL